MDLALLQLYWKFIEKGWVKKKYIFHPTFSLALIVYPHDSQILI